MKIDYYPITEHVAEKIRKKADVSFILLSSNYNETTEKKDTIVDVINSDIPGDFTGRLGEINILFLNNKITVLGGLGSYTKVTKEKIKETFNKMIQTYELQHVLQDNPIVMIYGPELKTHYLESMRESLHELNGIYKMNQMIADKTTSNRSKKKRRIKDLFRHVFIAQ